MNNCCRNKYSLNTMQVVACIRKMTKAALSRNLYFSLQQFKKIQGHKK